MLVLSRKLKEKLVFPTIGAAVQVLEIKHGVVRLGIDAPPEVPVLREEVADRAAACERGATRSEDPSADDGRRDQLVRRLRDRLQTTGTGLGLLRLQLDAGLTAEARATLAALLEDYQLLLHGVAGETENPPRAAATTRKPQRALLVEDDRDERELLAGFLRRSGLEVATAGDGADALDYLRAHGKPDVVLLDMGLPRVDGPTVVRELRHDPAYKGLKIFGVSGHKPDEFDLDQGPAGVDRWFQKPYDPAVLLHDLEVELDFSFCSA